MSSPASASSRFRKDLPPSSDKSPISEKGDDTDHDMLVVGSATGSSTSITSATSDSSKESSDSCSVPPPLVAYDDADYSRDFQ
eukprot:13350938-Alexandrium_andersonii.AAC.1